MPVDRYAELVSGLRRLKRQLPPETITGYSTSRTCLRTA